MQSFYLYIDIILIFIFNIDRLIWYWLDLFSNLWSILIWFSPMFFLLIIKIFVFYMLVKITTENKIFMATNLEELWIRLSRSSFFYWIWLRPSRKKTFKLFFKIRIRVHNCVQDGCRTLWIGLLALYFMVT